MGETCHSRMLRCVYSHFIRAVVWFVQSVPLQNVLQELLVANGGVRMASKGANLPQCNPVGPSACEAAFRIKCSASGSMQCMPEAHTSLL